MSVVSEDSETYGKRGLFGRYPPIGKREIFGRYPPIEERGLFGRYPPIKKRSFLEIFGLRVPRLVKPKQTPRVTETITYR